MAKSFNIPLLALCLCMCLCVETQAWSPDTSTNSIFTVLLIQGIVGTILYGVFEIVRGQREIYEPKRRSKPQRCPKADVPLTPFGWIAPTMAVSDEDTLAMVGMDGYVLLRCTYYTYYTY
jgi:hypothetical protein